MTFVIYFLLMAGKDPALVQDLSCTMLQIQDEEYASQIMVILCVSGKYFWLVLALCQVLLLPQG